MKRKYPKHKAWLRTLPCCVTGIQGYTEAAHIRYQTGGGMGLKPHDKWCIPLSSGRHSYQHEIGEKRFWGSMIDDAKNLALKLFEISGDTDTAINLIDEFREKYAVLR